MLKCARSLLRHKVLNPTQITAREFTAKRVKFNGIDGISTSRNYFALRNSIYSLNFQRPFSSQSDAKQIVQIDPESSEEYVQNEVNEDNEGVEYTLNMSQEELEKLTKGDPELIKKVKHIQLEHEVYRQEGMKVPSRIKSMQWMELLHLGSPNARKKYYNYLWLNEMKSESDKRKKEEKRKERIQNLPPLTPREEDPYGVTYGLGRNSICLRLYDTTVNKFYNNKIINAMMYSRPLVIDCSYDEFMTPREAKNCAKQLELMITENKTHKQPFDLYFCNADPNSKLIDYLSRIIPTMYDDSYPISLTSKSYLDIFPKKNLVYLTPHARDDLEDFSEDEVYIVGAMVDKSDPRPFSLAKAKKENLTMKKLPLDDHLVWGIGSKSLTINQIGNIMLDLRLTGDWKKALNHVPMRKLQRDFHPYPNSGNNEDKPKPFRKESKSSVLEDFELINQRKGYRNFGSNNSDSFSSYRPKTYFDKSSNDNKGRSNFNKPNNKNMNRGIRYDNEY